MLIQIAIMSREFSAPPHTLWAQYTGEDLSPNERISFDQSAYQALTNIDRAQGRMSDLMTEALKNGKSGSSAQAHSASDEDFEEMDRKLKELKYGKST